MKIWTAEGVEPVVDESRCHLASPLPVCPRCGGTARPNILMFGDGDWLDTRVHEQQARLEQWLGNVKKLVIIEVGAGTHIPTVRHFGEFQEGFRMSMDKAGQPRTMFSRNSLFYQGIVDFFGLGWMVIWWLRVGSNHRPQHYECRALTS